MKLDAIVTNGRIESCCFHTDFLSSFDDMEISDALEGQPYTEKSIFNVINSFETVRVFGNISQSDIGFMMKNYAM